MRCRNFLITAAFLVGLSLSFSACNAHNRLTEGQGTRLTEAQVVKIIDGDTIEVKIYGAFYKIRYIGIDSPEMGEPCFYEATSANRDMVKGKVIRLEKDASETDKYGRLLRYVYVDDIMVNAELVRRGYARAYTYPPDVKYNELFLDLQREAQREERGCWSLDD